MDMIEEEWEKSNGTKRIAELLAKRLDYQESLEKPTSNKTIDDRWGDMQKDRRKLIIKNRIHGFLFRIARKVYYIPLVKHISIENGTQLRCNNRRKRCYAKGTFFNP